MTAPTITAVGVSPSGGDFTVGDDLTVGDVVTVTLTMSEVVTVSTSDSPPTVTLNGGVASYSGGSGTNQLLFTYTVVAGQNTSALVATLVNLNDATITDNAGNAANMSLSGLSQTAPGVLTSPVVTSVVATGNGITAGVGDVSAGTVVTLTVNFNEAVTVAGGTPTLALSDGGTATYVSGSGSNALVFKYTVAAGQNTSALGITAVNLNSATVTSASTITSGGGGSLTDPSGNVWSFGGSAGGGNNTILENGVKDGFNVGATLVLANGVVWNETSAGAWFMNTVTGFQSQYASTGPANTAANLSEAVTTLPGLQIDTASGPTISSVVESNSSSVLVAGNTVTLTLNMSEAVTVNTAGGTPTLTLNDGATATYVGGSGSGALAFTYTVAAGQNTAALAATTVNLNGAVIKDSAGNAASVSLSGLTQTGPQIDTAAPKVFYVSSETGSDNNAGTSANAPLATLQAAANLVQAGDIVEVMNGTYTGPAQGAVVNITTSGTASAPIIFEAAPGQTPVINTTNDWQGINIEASNIVINGFTVVGNAANYTYAQAVALNTLGSPLLNSAGISVNTPGGGVVPNHITIENNTVYDQPEAGITANNADYIQILNNVVYGNAHWSQYGGSGIEIGSSINSDTNPGVHDVISGNLSFDNTELVPEHRAQAITDGEGIILDTNYGSTAADPTYVGEFLVENNTTYGNSGPGIEAYLTNNAVITGNTDYGDVTNAREASGGEPEIFSNSSTNITITNNNTAAPSLTPPAAPVISGDTVNDYVNGFVPTILTVNGTAEAYSTITLFDNSILIGTTTTNGSGAWTFDIVAPANGSESFTATATDSVGNVSLLSSPFAVALNVPVNLVANGNFATGDFTDWNLGANWTWTYGQEITIDGSIYGASTNAEGGSYYAAKLDSIGSDGTISQTVATTAGQSYTFSFWLKNVGSGPNDFKALWNGQTLLSLTNTQFGYTEYSYTVTATSSTSTLEFASSTSSGLSNWYLDNISVAAAPTGPSVSSVVASGTGITAGSGDVGVGSVVTLTINMSEAVTVAGGTPTLTLNDGGTATYTGGSGTNALTFSYTVGTGQNTSDLAVTAVSLNAATVTDGTGKTTNLSGAVTTPTGTLQIDTTAPTVSSLVASGTGITAGSGDLGVGKVVTLTLNMSEAVTVAGGTPTLTLNDGGTATYAGGSGTNALTFSYTVGAGQNASDLTVTAFNANSASIKDGAGNAANLSGALISPTGTLQIDTTTPSVSSVVTSGTGITAGSGDLGVGRVVTLTLNMSEAVTVAGGTPTLTLNDGGTATYTGGSGTSALTFSYTVAAGQNTPDLTVTAFNSNSATIKNGAGTAASLTGAVTSPSGTLQIDTAAPTVTQVIASPGSGTENPGDVITLTVDLSKAVTVTGTPTLSLNDGATATYVSGSGTNALTFSYTVGATDSTVPTLAITQVNLPGGATVKDAAGNTANLSGAVTTFPGLSIDPPPVLISVAETPSNGDLNAGKTVSLTLTLNDVVTVSGGTPTLTLNDGGTASYTGGSGTNALTFSYTVGTGQNTASLAATGLTLNGATVQNSLGEAAVVSFNGVTQTGSQIDTATPTVTSVAASGTGITAGSGDLPAGSVVTLTINLSETVTVAGGTPTLALSDGGTATYSGGSGTNALTFSYTVGGGQSAADLTITAVNLGTATVKDGAGNAANLSGAVTSLAGTLQIDGTTTHIAQVGSNYFLDNINGSGPELKYGGAVVTAGEFAGWTPIAAVEVAGGGYDVAWKNTSAGLYTVWSTDSNGNYTSNVIGAVSGTSTALEALETTFNQDLNGDGTIGIPKIAIQTDGSTVLTQVGNNFFLNSTGGGTGPELSYGGAAVTTGEFAGWTAIGAVHVSGGGYDVAWENASAGLYTVWSTNSSGNYLSNVIGAVSGNSLALETLETTFNQDLNGDGTTGVTKVAIQTDGSTTLTQAANTYALYNNGGSGPTLEYGGSAVTVGEFAGWTAIGAVQVAGGGYDVAWKDASAGLYTVWSTDSNGNYLSNVIGAVSGTSTSLEALETTFNQDLNGDGTIGIPHIVIQTDGSTSLVQVGNNYFLDPVGGSSGPELSYGGAAVTTGEFAGWTAIGAVQVAGGGYDVAWENASAGLYTVWSTNSSGNYTSNVIGAVSGSSTALETLENTFQQDLNGDGVIGIYAAPGTNLQISNSLSGPSGSATIGAGATLELAASNSSSVTFTSSTGSLVLDQPSTFDGVIFGFTGNGTLSGSDQIDLKGLNFGNIQDSYSNGVLTVSNGTQSAELDFSGSYVLANFEFASDGHGGTIVYDPPVSSTNQDEKIPAETRSDSAPADHPSLSALDQRLALFSQHMASAFPSSGFGSGGPQWSSHLAELGGSPLVAPVKPNASNQHA